MAPSNIRSGQAANSARHPRVHLANRRNPSASQSTLEPRDKTPISTRKNQAESQNKSQLNELGFIVCYLMQECAARVDLSHIEAQYEFNICLTGHRRQSSMEVHLKTFLDSVCLIYRTVSCIRRTPSFERPNCMISTCSCFRCTPNLTFQKLSSAFIILFKSHQYNSKSLKFRIVMTVSKQTRGMNVTFWLGCLKLKLQS